MSELFGRNVEIQFGRPGVVGKSHKDLRISFDVHMTRTAEPNTAAIQVYNLNDQSIAELQQKDVVVRLFAGYDIPKLVFEGNPIIGGIRPESGAVDRVLTIEAKDGGKAYRSARLEASFATQTSIRQVFNAAATAMGLPVGVVQLPEGIRFPNGLTFSGPAREVLDRVANIADADWFIRDGAIVMLGKDSHTGEFAPVFSAKEKNLIGSPVITDTGVDIVGLLDPSVRPGRKFRVRSRDVNGDFIASDVQFVGDAGWDTPFYVKIKGVPIK